jgi:Asp-tRNA(Asn)/Glu-tRNA(Gln) amidotransferase A subunit family amidase
MRNFWDKKWIHQYDAYIAPVDFNEEMYKSTKKLRIGYFDTNGFLEPLPVMKRAVNEARERLERNGHELVLFEPPNVLRAYYLFTMAVTLDNGRFIINRWDSVRCSSPNFTFLNLGLARSRLSTNVDAFKMAILASKASFVSFAPIQSTCRRCYRRVSQKHTRTFTCLSRNRSLLDGMEKAYEREKPRLLHLSSLSVPSYAS